MSGGYFTKPRHTLTPREIQIVRLLCEGHKIYVIATDLGIRPRTLKAHRERIAEKTGRARGAALGVWAIRHGIVSP